MKVWAVYLAFYDATPLWDLEYLIIAWGGWESGLLTQPFMRKKIRADHVFYENLFQFIYIDRDVFGHWFTI